MSSLPFEEKHRPRSLRGVAGNTKLMSNLIPEVDAVIKDNARLKFLFSEFEKVGKDDVKRKAILREIGSIKTHKMRHKIFAGDAGCGKTTTAEAIGHDIYGENFHGMFHEFNASDDRTIVFVRDIVKNLTRTGTREYSFCIIFLDEIDGMQKPAQEGLRRIIELSTSAVFILACNDLDKVIDALKSRCTVCRFFPVEVKVAVEKLQEICKMEGIKATDEVLEELYLSRFGDLRNAIGRLGELSMTSMEITKEMIEEKAVDNDIFDTFYSLAASGQVRKAYRHFLKSRIDGGFSQEEFASRFSRRILSLKIDDEIKSQVFTFVKENKIGNDSDIGILGLCGKIYLSANGKKETEKRDAFIKTITEKVETLSVASEKIDKLSAISDKIESIDELVEKLDKMFEWWENAAKEKGSKVP